MRILSTVFILGALLVLASCGDAPVGFNIAKEVPLDIPVELEGINDPKLPQTGLINPPAYAPDPQTFNLSDVTSDTGDNIEVVINGLAYEITGVDNTEDFQMDEFTIIVEDGTTLRQLSESCQKQVFEILK